MHCGGSGLSLALPPAEKTSRTEYLQEPFAKPVNPLFSAAFRGFESPTSRRNFSQPSLADATMKNWDGMEKVRCLGLGRNYRHLQFVAMAMNMKRAKVLVAASRAVARGRV